MDTACEFWLDGVQLSARDCREIVRLNLILLTLSALGAALALAVKWSPLRHYRLRVRLARRKAERDEGGDRP